MNTDPTARIRALNDLLRQHRIGGRIVVTRGVAAQRTGFVARALEMIGAHATFDGSNDPHGEHDFGRAIVDSVPVLWKIDYYDETLAYGAEDPADASTCHRVLTVMLADEY